MAHISHTPIRRASSFIKKIAIVASLAACGMAQASVLNFEQPVDSPFLTHSTRNFFGLHYIDTYAGGTTANPAGFGDLAGALIDGTDNGLCFLACPTNDPSNYYAGLDDGYLYVGLNSGAKFKMTNLRASFLTSGDGNPLAAFGLLLLTGLNAAGGALTSSLQVALFPDVNGVNNFLTYDLTGTAFGQTYVNRVQILGYACDAAGNCLRTAGLGNFAIDDIETVPEPTSWALFALGLLGLGAFSRRRAA